MVLDFLTRLQDFTEVLMSDPHILMDRRLKFFRDFLVAMGADETFLLTTTGEQEELDRSELFDALEACSYGNFFLRQGKYTDAIDAFTNASQLASNVRYFDEAKLSAYQQMTSEYVPSSVEDISNKKWK
ncbi:Tetratricopeptide-like helical domain-containing protein [Strongyloides ratti]|uniref:Tetratricopeptide-like helical domain-containing protein n=1 Tax=Strongyloides ratti TaxID=34506 RepID=A0A090MWZ7_STRRB|nr:Tetratricopeptide-like helical domain-containing protein [Strongyloides ratti]CEF64554.1 Tetratricopeptide-like helical domain-containing protein [Strongyloides ratti]